MTISDTQRRILARVRLFIAYSYAPVASEIFLRIRLSVKFGIAAERFRVRFAQINSFMRLSAMAKGLVQTPQIRTMELTPTK